MFDLNVYVHGKHMRPQEEGQLLNQTVPVQPNVVCQHLVPIISPVTDNFLLDIQKRHCFRMCGIRGLISELLAYKADTLDASFI